MLTTNPNYVLGAQHQAVYLISQQGCRFASILLLQGPVLIVVIVAFKKFARSVISASLHKIKCPMKGTSPGIVHVRGNMDYKTKRRFAFKQNPWRPHVTMFQKHF